MNQSKYLDNLSVATRQLLRFSFEWMSIAFHCTFWKTQNDWPIYSEAVSTACIVLLKIHWITDVRYMTLQAAIIKKINSTIRMLNKESLLMTLTFSQLAQLNAQMNVWMKCVGNYGAFNATVVTYYLSCLAGQFQRNSFVIYSEIQIKLKRRKEAKTQTTCRVCMYVI